jgi:histidyl-tRNA synthetase
MAQTKQQNNKKTGRTKAKQQEFEGDVASRISRIRGMKDIMPEEYKYWRLITKKADDLATSYGFKRIETPTVERADLYKKSTGEDTDIVSKEMYSFQDKNGEKLALRPEATPGLVRAYIEHGMFNMPQPVKLFWFGPIFRHEKPQAGRYRQSHQLDFEVFGSDNAGADFLTILLTYNLFSELQLNVQIQINSIGCAECRPQYVEELKKYYRSKKSGLCADCKKRLNKNPLRLLDCKEEGCKELKQEAPPIIDYLCDGCREHFTKVLEYMDELDVPYDLNPQLVRGLDYYNRTVFEVWSVDENRDIIEGEPSLGGGGRYDGLVEKMGGRPTPSCGVGIGVERTVTKIRSTGIPMEDKDKDGIIYLAHLGEQPKRHIFRLFEELRKAGYRVKQNFAKEALKPQLDDANKLGAKITLILGQKELNDGTILFRDMESGNQEIVDFKKIRQELDKRLKNGV